MVSENDEATLKAFRSFVGDAANQGEDKPTHGHQLQKSTIGNDRFAAPPDSSYWSCERTPDLEV